MLREIGVRGLGEAHRCNDVRKGGNTHRNGGDLVNVTHPGAHSRASNTVSGYKRRLRYDFLQIFEQGRRFDQWSAVVYQCGHHTVRIQLEIFWSELLEFVEIDVMLNPIFV